MNTAKETPEFITVGSDFSNAQARFQNWYQQQIAVAGSSMPAILTLQVIALEDDVAEWLLGADSGDTVTVWLDDGVRIRKVMYIDSIERAIDYNGRLIASIDLTEASGL